MFVLPSGLLFLCRLIKVEYQSVPMGLSYFVVVVFFLFSGEGRGGGGVK